jgi:cellulose synthase/poly-beta-1,6-N-acetylglucosamine synthase-like glycosyltransferase
MDDAMKKSVMAHILLPVHEGMFVGELSPRALNMFLPELVSTSLVYRRRYVSCSLLLDISFYLLHIYIYIYIYIYGCVNENVLYMCMYMHVAISTLFFLPLPSRTHKFVSPSERVSPLLYHINLQNICSPPPFHLVTITLISS